MGKISYLICFNAVLSLTSCESPEQYVRRVGPYQDPDRSYNSEYAASASRVSYPSQPDSEIEPPAPQRAVYRESEEDKAIRLSVQIALALATKVGSRPVDTDDISDAFVKQLADYGADAVIEMTIDEAYPDESQFVRRQLIHFLCAVGEGDYTLSSLPIREGKAQCMDWLEAQNPAWAQNAEIGDFMYALFQRL